MTAEPASSSPRYLLFRIDDRLLHGQVALGWGRQLSPRTYLIADDSLAADPDAAELYEMSAPEETRVVVTSIERLIQGGRDLPDPAGSFLLVRDLSQAARLLRGGIPGPVNLGGLHARAGADSILPYLFLSEEDRRMLRLLHGEGVAFTAQDLPENPEHDLRNLGLLDLPSG